MTERLVLHFLMVYVARYHILSKQHRSIQTNIIIHGTLSSASSPRSVEIPDVGAVAPHYGLIINL